MCELRKIEARKKEREKKTQDLQKLISADTDARKITKTTKKKIQQTKITKLDTLVRELNLLFFSRRIISEHFLCIEILLMD